ncbi:MAG: twin-arginine translocase TatA/TatE family subunit [Deltaproteobacteria bacterium]|nr:twin-arginine translocase TatA/TatE family subunit [Sandaracinaceae bacterium]MCX7808309.1 twin-arginine translocase TatA/TatE family subunit [Deltaproteobacteria bacterium]
MGELIVILLIVLLVFGASRLPQIGEGIGKAIRAFKRGLQEEDSIEVQPGPGPSHEKPSLPSGQATAQSPSNEREKVHT